MKKLFILLIIVITSFTFADDISLLRKSLIMSTLWQSTSAEYRALAHQAYNIARLRLDEDLKIKRAQKRAIIVDADETAIDNSSFQARMIVDGDTYSNDFDNWVESAEAKAVPGALDFLNYAHENGCEIYYISNRKLHHIEGTLNNLKALGFPQATKTHILLKDDTSDKGIRRDFVAENYFIVMLIGDNLIDFEDIFRKKSIEERYLSVEKFKDEFGKKFIILPNPMYGEWEKTLYGGTRQIPEKEKEKKLWEHLNKNK
ncbi:MAG: 5'-nucleotidase, lipoprotein e(P4) family [Candidatus Cloacimonetes bacterium]|jgi:5'-nucleotidase (lipoprotein e(P4) family)|nr:5'-nucleotidase, lipoprotein e(P4) family [Candidatus Cloacimonadota bacterium]MBT5419412.1 5'-nucleotidase, lipoprotein e(P4) family [Candidatus Cloacimonadota bacterium]